MSIATALERYMVELINEERTSRGLSALQIDQNLNRSSDAHSQWMTDEDTFSHTGVRGTSSSDRIREADMDLSGSWGTAENIAATSIIGADSYTDEVLSMHGQLMNSPGHRANILNPDLEYIGVGLAFGPMTYSNGVSMQSVIVTQNFAHTSGSADLDLLGDNGSNRLIGEGGDDVIDGGLGHDTLDGGNGADRLQGGSGFDVIHGGNGNDMIWGGALGDRLYGDNGNDTVNGGFGRDTAYLGNGNDTFIDNGQGGWLGGDVVFAGAGNDLIRGGGGADRFYGGHGQDVIFGGNGNDMIVGGAGGDRIFAGNHNDTVNGGFGRDTAYLGNGDDTFIDNGQGGWLGGDVVHGGAGNDSITLMGGADRATGGSGADTFIFAGSAIGADTVTDYTVGVDALHLDSALWSGDLSAAEVVDMFADDSTGSTVFDFGNGNSVTLDGVSDASALVADLVLI